MIECMESDTIYVTSSRKWEAHINHDFKIYPSRYLVALLLCISSGLNGYILTTFVSFWTIAMEFFSSNSMGINMFTIVYEVLFFPGSIFSIFITEKYGTGYATLLGAFANFLCLWIRYTGSLNKNAFLSYSIVLLGQAVAAFGQPLLLNCPARIANDWFPIDERDMAIHIMAQANNVGTALGVLIPAYQVAMIGDISDILFWQGIAGTIILLLASCYVRDRPPTPPGKDVMRQLALRSSLHLDTARATKVILQMFKDFKVMLNQRNFLYLLFSFACELGVSWTFSAVVGQMIFPCGYDMSVVGIAGSSLSFSGVLGSLLIAQYLRHHKDYLRVQKCVVILTALSAILCLTSIAPGNLIYVIITWNLFGLFQGPIIPITLEHAAEMTYPIPADTSAALLFTVANVVCLIITILLTPLLKFNVSITCSSIISPASVLVFLFVVTGAIICLPMRPEYRRLKEALAFTSSEALMASPICYGSTTTVVNVN